MTDNSISIGENSTDNKIIQGDHNIIVENTIIQQAQPPPSGPLFSIPAPPNNFTGRADEITDLLTHFAQSAQSASGVTISGLSGGGGVGKSALARVLVEKLADQYPDARLHIDLQGAPHSGQIPLTPVEALRRLLQSFHPTTQLPDDLLALQAILTDTLRDKRVLILLDNAHNAAQVRPLLPPTPSAAIVTSRTQIILTDLGLYNKELGKLPSQDARILLRKNAPSLQNTDDVTVDALADQCGALPLALNVAAALLASRPDWTPTRLIQLLSDERTRLLHLKMPDDPDLDVEASLSLSYNLLDEENQRRFRTLGIFPAPFDLPALSALWNLTLADCDLAIGVFIRLSLLETRPADPMPYRLHDLTRIYAEDRLREQTEEWTIAVRHHADYFLQQGWEGNKRYNKGHEHAIESLRHFDLIRPHLRTAYERNLPNAGDPQADDWLNKFPARVVRTLELRLTPRQQIPLLESALAVARRLKDRYREGIHLGNLGMAYKNIGEPYRAIEIYKQRLEIAREIGDRRGEGKALGNLGLIYAYVGELRHAIELYEERLVIAREIGDRRGEGNGLHNLGQAYADLGEPKRAIELYEQRLIIARELGNLRREGSYFSNMGRAYAALGEHRHAIELYEQQLVIAYEIGDRREEGQALGNLGNAYSALGEPDKAIGYHERALKIAHEIGDRRDEGQALGNLGNSYAALGEPDKAISYFKQHLLIACEIGHQQGEAKTRWNMGLLLADQGQFQQAAELMQVLVDYYNAIGHSQAAALAQQVDEVKKKGN